MKKTIYEAPQMEQIQVRFEENIMSDVQRAASAPDMTKHTADDWGEWE